MHDIKDLMDVLVASATQVGQFVNPVSLITGNVDGIGSMEMSIASSYVNLC